MSDIDTEIFAVAEATGSTPEQVTDMLTKMTALIAEAVEDASEHMLTLNHERPVLPYEVLMFIRGIHGFRAEADPLHEGEFHYELGKLFAHAATAGRYERG